MLCMMYLALDPASKVIVLPLIVKRVPAGEFREKSYLPAMSKKRTPVYLTAKLYVLAAMSALTPLNDKAAACTAVAFICSFFNHSSRYAEAITHLRMTATTAWQSAVKQVIMTDLTVSFSEVTKVEAFGVRPVRLGARRCLGSRK